MALSTHIPKEITTYKERILGEFSARQLISVASTVGLLAGSYVVLVRMIHLSMDIYPYFAMVLCAPTLAIGFYSKGNIPFEQYLLLLWRHYMGKNKLSWQAEFDNPVIVIESEESINATPKTKKSRKAVSRSRAEVEFPKEKSFKDKRKAIQREIKKAKAESRTAQRNAKAAVQARRSS